MHASTHGHLGVVNVLLAAGANVDEKSNYCGKTALMHASRYGHLDVVAALLKAKAKVDARDRYGTTALIKAASHGHSDVVDALLAAGATVDATANNGDTALMLASKHRHLDVVEALLLGGAQTPDAVANELQRDDAQITEEYRVCVQAVNGLGGLEGVAAAHRAWLESLPQSSVARQRWELSRPGRRTKAAR
jgi:ankyrin repeat protein